MKPLTQGDLDHLRGAVKLLAEGATEVTDIVEAMHATIQRAAGPLDQKNRPQRTRAISALVYRMVRGGLRGSAKVLDAALAVMPARASNTTTSTATRLDLLAGLNGVFGDYLDETDNPLAMPMSFQLGGSTLSPAQIADHTNFPSGTAPTLLLCVHGLCLNEGHWRRDGHDHGAAIAEHFGWTPIYLRYNTGCSIASNGKRLDLALEALRNQWPETPLKLHILAHSMGGLVTRSAIHHAKKKHCWTKSLRSVSFLGTPHGGAPLERAGHRLDRLLDISPYSAPFVRLGAARSAGITDLRHGRIDEDGTAKPRLPKTLPAFTVAATLAARRGQIKDRMLGDGLVPVRSALGLPGLNIPEARQRIVPETGHLELLSSPIVFEQLIQWLEPLVD